jgi:O-antigen biosynthesis protein
MIFNPLDHPMLLRDPLHLPPHGSWVGHIPLAFLLVETMRPEVIVELGVFQGASYCAFCQAVAELGLRTRCFGIDTWQGDRHTGVYQPESVLRDLRDHHDPLYSGFSQFVQADFDTAAAHVGEGTIDLLHIDGLHTYEGVRHDFQTWLPKLSDRGVVLLHDTSVRDEDFGVWRLWEELAGRYPSFEFTHSNGLGVIAVGSKVEPKLLEFLACARENPTGVRRVFELLAERIGDERMLRQLGDFLNVTQGYLDNWKRRIGKPVQDAPVDAQQDPLSAAQRTARDLKELSKATATEPSETTTFP